MAIAQRVALFYASIRCQDFPHALIMARTSPRKHAYPVNISRTKAAASTPFDPQFVDDLSVTGLKEGKAQNSMPIQK